MEALTEFQIEVDITDCEKLYDFNKQELLTKPATGWDWSQLEARAAATNTEPADETAAFRINRLDKALSDKGFFEKKGEKTGKDNVPDHFDEVFSSSPGRRRLAVQTLPLYELGDVVKGHLNLDISEDIKTESVDIQLLGHASTNIRIYHGRGYYDDRGNINYLNETKSLWQKSDGKTTSDTTELLEPTVGSGQYIPAGKHRFPFEFIIPADGLPSVPPLVTSHADYAFISWRLKAIINKDKMLRRGNIVTHKGIWVERPVKSTFNVDPTFMSPFRVEEERETGIFGSAGMISCRIDLSRKLYMRNETVPVRLEIDNKSDGIIEEVKVCIVLGGKYRAKDSKWHGSRSIKVKSTRVREGPVSGGTSPVYNLEIPLDFNGDALDSNLIPGGTLEDCPIIDIHYDVVVELKRKGLHRNIKLEAPIVIGNGTPDTLYPSLKVN